MRSDPFASLRMQALAHLLTDVIVPIAFVFLIPVLGTFWYLDHQNQQRIHDAQHTAYEAQLASCERGNALRARLNEMSDTNAETFGAAAAILTNLSETEAGKRLAEALANASRRQEHFPRVDCKKTIPAP